MGNQKAESGTSELYFVRRGEQEHGPWSIAQVRRYLLICGDPHPDYDIRDANGGPWFKASEMEPLSSLFDPASMTIRTTQGESPSGKAKKVKKG